MLLLFVRMSRYSLCGAVVVVAAILIPHTERPWINPIQYTKFARLELCMCTVCADTSFFVLDFVYCCCGCFICCCCCRRCRFFFSFAFLLFIVCCFWLLMLLLFLWLSLILRLVVCKRNKVLSLLYNIDTQNDIGQFAAFMICERNEMEGGFWSLSLVVHSLVSLFFGNLSRLFKHFLAVYCFVKNAVHTKTKKHFAAEIITRYDNRIRWAGVALWAGRKKLQ